MEYHAVRKSRKPLNSIENELYNSQFRIIFAISEIFSSKIPTFNQTSEFWHFRKISNWWSKIHFNLVGLEKFKNEIGSKCLFGCKCPGTFYFCWYIDESSIMSHIKGSMSHLDWSRVDCYRSNWMVQAIESGRSFSNWRLCENGGSLHKKNGGCLTKSVYFSIWT